MAIPLYTGSVDVPSTGTLTVEGTATLNATGANTLNSNTTGSAVAFILNNNNGTPTSGDLLDIQKGGVTKLQVLNGGGVTSQGDFVTGSSTYGATSATVNGSIYGTATNSLFGNTGGIALRAGASTGAIFFQPGGLISGGYASYVDGNGLTVSNNSGTTSNYGPTSATVNGQIKAGGPVVAGNAGTLGTSAIYSGTGAPSFSAPNGSLFMRYDGGSNAHLYINTSGASTSGTTWTAVTD